MSSITHMSPVTFSIPMTDLICPITNDWYIDPVLDIHGHIFERSALLTWADTTKDKNEEGQCICPVNSEIINIKELFPVLTVKAQAEAARNEEANPDQEPPKITLEEGFKRLFKGMDDLHADVNAITHQMTILNGKFSETRNELAKETEKVKIQFVQLENALEIHPLWNPIKTFKWALFDSYRQTVLDQHLDARQQNVIRAENIKLGAKWDENPGTFFEPNRKV